MLHLHSTIAIVLLLALVISIVITLSNYLGNKPYNRKIALLGFIASHIQLLVGLILFFYLKYPSMISGAVMKDPALRFKIIEHPLTMIIAIVLITIGYSKAKKIENARKANQTVVIFYIIGLILMLARIPWSTWSIFA